MDFFSYFLPLMVVFPIIMQKLRRFYLKRSYILLQFLWPLLFLGFSGLSFFYGRALEISFWHFSSYFSFGLKLDVLSGVIGSTVSVIGLVVARFSIRYLEDDPKRDMFARNLSYTLSFVLLMLMAPNLVLFFLSWFGASYFLHQLLTHFSDRAAAQEAAQQKFWVSRLGDGFIIFAGIILFIVFQSLEFKVIFQMIEDSRFVQENFMLINMASLSLVLGAMTKSAQFPFHFWLPNTMETPTPVSALMHAGIINAGGYLVIRMSPLLVSTPLALSILALIGAFTAFWATIVMFTQPNVKRNLAYSTISQMGFMMLQCGLGAFSIAVVHIIGHAFYKAFAFLSSASSTDLAKLNRYYPRVKTAQSLWSPYVLAFISLTLALGSFMYLGHSVWERPGTSALLIVLALAVSQIFLNSKDKLKAFVGASTLVILYLALTNMMSFLLAGIIPYEVPIKGLVGGMTLFICVFFFFALYLFQNSLDRISKTKWGKKIYVKALNGGFS